MRPQLISSDPRSQNFPNALCHTSKQKKVPRDQNASGTEPVSVQQVPPAKARHAPLLSSLLGSPPPQFTFSKIPRLEVKQFPRSTISRYFTQKGEKATEDKQQQVVTKQCFKLAFVCNPFISTVDQYSSDFRKNVMCFISATFSIPT